MLMMTPPADRHFHLNSVESSRDRVSTIVSISNSFVQFVIDRTTVVDDPAIVSSSPHRDVSRRERPQGCAEHRMFKA